MASPRRVRGGSDAQAGVSAGHVGGEPVEVGGGTARELVAEARRQLRPVRRATRWAALSGWTTLVFGAGTLALSLLGGALLGRASVAGALVGVGLVASGWLELDGRRRLHRFDASAARALVISQAVLAVTLVAYGSWQVWRYTLGGASLTPTLDAIAGPGSVGDPSVEEMVGGMRELAVTLTVAIYASVALVGLVHPPIAAWLYTRASSRAQRVKDRSPAWVVEAVTDERFAPRT